MLAAFPFTDFGDGLRLVDQAAEFDRPTALDLQNVRVGVSGEVRSRSGTALVGEQDWHSLRVSGAGGSARYIGADAIGVEVIDAAGTLIDSAALANDEPLGFAAFGAPGTERMYAANGEDLLYWDGSGLVVNPTVSDGEGSVSAPRPVALAVTPWDNRLMAAGYTDGAAGPGGAASSPHHVYLSDQGDPHTWKETWRELLHPGDGERIVAAVTWGDRVFVFKQSKFFVFHGTSIVDGHPVFDFYAVNAGCGVRGVKAVAAGRRGVYFCDGKGIYMTQGEFPERISEPLDPLFESRTPPFFSGPPLEVQELGDAALAVAGEKLYCALPSVGGPMTYVYDVDHGWWGLDSFAARALAEDRLGPQESLVMAVGEAGVQRHQPGLVDDAGEPFASWWRSSWQTFGEVGEKVVRQSRGWGSGRIALGYAADFGTIEATGTLDMRGRTDLWADGTDPDDTWGDGGDAGDLWGRGGGFTDDWVRHAVQGAVLSFELRGLNGAPWSVQRVEHHVGATRRAAVDTQQNE